MVLTEKTTQSFAKYPGNTFTLESGCIQSIYIEYITKSKEIFLSKMFISFNKTIQLLFYEMVLNFKPYSKTPECILWSNLTPNPFSKGREPGLGYLKNFLAFIFHLKLF